MNADTLTADTYEQTRSAPGIVVIAWHGADGPQVPPVDETLVDNGLVKVATIDGEVESTLAGLAHVSTLPTTVIYRDGLEVFRSEEPLDADAVASTLTSVRELDMADVREKVAMADADDHRGG